MSFTRSTLHQAEVYFRAPRLEEPVLGDIVAVGYPAVAIDPKRPLEDVAGRPISRVVRAVWEIQVARLGRV